MADAALPTDVTINGNIERWVGEDEIGSLGPEQASKRLLGSRVPADEAVATQVPKVAEARRRPEWIGERPNVILGTKGTIGRGVPSLVQDHVNLRLAEAGEVDVEIEVDQGLELDRQDLPIPPGVLGKFVVGQDIGPALGGAQVRQTKSGHLGAAQELGGLDPPVAGYDLVLVRDQDWVREAEPLDALGDLPQLLLRVSAGIAGVGPERGEFNRLNEVRRPGCARLPRRV